MQAFSHSQNFVLSNPIITDRSVNYQSGRNGIDILRESSAPEAAFDSEFRRYAPSCFPGTRSQYIEDIVNWGTAQSNFPIYRMTGPAGVGKSAIAQTCAEELRDRCQLGASFFFKVNGCDDYSRFLTSISYQLSTTCPDYHEILNKKLQLDPTLVGKQLRSQFRGLIVEPLRELERASKPIGRRIILVDGLDECKDKDAQREIIEIMIASIVTHSTPFSWAFFSRPEPQIEAAFADHRIASLCLSTFLPVSRGIDGEVELYLRSGLQNILRRRGITTSDPWPSEQDLCTLVSAAQGLYIYAATILRFVGRTDTQHDPPELLRMVIKRYTPGSDGGSTKTPFEELDAFYTLILQRVPDVLHSSVQLLLSLMVVDHIHGEPHKTGIRFLSNALRFTESKTKMLCGELVAVVCHTDLLGTSLTNRGLSSFNVTSYRRSSSSALLSPVEEVYAREEWLSFYHKTFTDFLCDPVRSGPFCITTPTMRIKLFQHLVELHMDYSKFYSFQSKSGLVLAANNANTTADLPHVLSWRSASESINYTSRAIVFADVGAILLDHFFPYHDLDDRLLGKLSHMDHRKQLLIQSEMYFEENEHIRGSTFRFNCGIKNVQGTVLCSASHRDMLSFNVEKFQMGISRLEEAQIIQRYQPSSTTLELPLFRYDSVGNLLSGLYIKGRGEMSTFWYWFLDPDMRYYREFEAVDLVEGSRIFREENFEWWPDDEFEDEMEEEEEEEGQKTGIHQALPLSGKSGRTDDELQGHSM